MSQSLLDEYRVFLTTANVLELLDFMRPNFEEWLSLEFINTLTPKDWELTIQCAQTTLAPKRDQAPNAGYIVLDAWNLLAEMADTGIKSKSQETRWWSWATLCLMHPGTATEHLFPNLGEYHRWQDTGEGWPKELILHRTSRLLHQRILLEPVSTKDLLPLLNAKNKQTREIALKIMAAMPAHQVPISSKAISR